MSQLSVSQFSTLNWSFFEDVIRYSTQGFDSIGIWRAKAEDFGVLDAVDLIHEMKMSVSSLHWAGGFTGSDGRSHKDAVEDGIEAIYLAAAFNADCLLLHTGARNCHTPRHSNRLINSALESLLPIAEDLDVSLAIEPMCVGDATNWTFLNTFQQSWEILERFPSSNLGFVLDLFHVGQDEQLFREIGDRIKKLLLVQVSDQRIEYGETTRCPLGTGNVDLSAWLAELTRLNYQGAYEVELQGPTMTAMDNREMLSNSKEFLTRTLTEAATTNFIHSGINS